MRSKAVYINTLDIEALPGAAAKKLVEIPIPAASMLGAWKLGIDTEEADTEGIRIVAMLQVGPEGCADDPPAAAITEILDSFLFRAGRALQAPPFTLPAPYEFEPDERLYLFLKLTNRTAEPVKARANVYAYFVSLEGGDA
jgi:hypothetical protein